MPDHPDLFHHCETVTQQIRAILKANHVFIQRYLAATGTWQSLATLQEYDRSIAPPDKEPEVSGELTLVVGQQLRNLEIADFRIVTKIGHVLVRGDCLLLPIAVGASLGEGPYRGQLWGRICIIGNERAWQNQGLEWLKMTATMLGQFISLQTSNDLSLELAQVGPPLLRLNTEESIDNLHNQIAELAARDQAKDEFISKISHDLRAPLMNMRMALKMLQINVSQNPAAAAVFSGERIASYFQILNSECEREIALINNVLDLQKLETGNVNLQIAAIELSDWLPLISSNFQSRAQSLQQKLELRLSSTPALLNTDENYLSRVLTELFHNACKYTANGGQIVCEVDYPPAHSGYGRQPIYITVSNQAEIAVSDLPHIFDRFYRVPTADHHKQGGTGLGLFLVRNLVEQLQGQITVQSSNGWTTFTVALPVSVEVPGRTSSTAHSTQGTPSNPQLIAEL
jgi:signal transduction histidine kinase